MPNLQQIYLCGFEYDGSESEESDEEMRVEHKYSDGEDPDEVHAARTANYTTYDIEIISNFSKLRILEVEHVALNGRYPFLFNSFPLLQKLSITGCVYLKWDLEMLAGFPVLKTLTCVSTNHLTGNINSLRVLKDTLEKVHIHFCPGVEGNFMDLADLPHLKRLDLLRTAVTGDIWDIGANDFSALEQLTLPQGVYGGRGSMLQQISDGPDLMRTLYVFNKQRPNLIDSLNESFWELSEDSVDWYERRWDQNAPPFCICFVEAGSRLGYRWENFDGDNPCEVNWLDPEPDSENTDYDEYIEELQEINSQVHMFRGFHQPPTEEEYIRLCEGFGDD
jgi:hypothetical protein